MMVVSLLFKKLGSKIRIVFAGGQCCQKCGYRIWVKCTPQSSNANNGIIAWAKRDVKKHEVQTILFYFIIILKMLMAD